MRGVQVTLDEFFEAHKESRKIFARLQAAMADLTPGELRVTRSQIAFVRRRPFAWAWIPARYLRGKVAPLVLTIARSERDRSARWKEVVEVTPGRFMHHLELYTSGEIDDEVSAWLREAWVDAA